MKYTIEAMEEDGCSTKMAKYFYELLSNERESQLWDEKFKKFAHDNGFLAASASAYGLNEKNINQYLSDYDFYKIWPLNSWQRIWINDKLTLKYMLANTEFDKYMPKYYCYTEKSGQISLIDMPDNEERDVVAILKNIKELACKPCNGSGSEGFYKLEYKDGNYFLNSSLVGEDEVHQFVKNHSNYVFTEYLHPETTMANIFPLIHTIRIQVINRTDGQPLIVGGYLRFGTSGTGASNLMKSSTEAQFDYDVAINCLTGEYGDAKAVYLNKVIDMPKHPDSNVLAEGRIECWDEVLNMIKGICRRFNTIEYMAFDICISTQGIKIMEINSHGGIKHLQLRKPFFSEMEIKDYYTKKIDFINGMTDEEKHIHKKIPR